MQLKLAIEPEPSDSELLLALEALQIDGFISGISRRDHTTGERKLAAMMQIRITGGEGRRHLAGKNRQTEHAPAVFHGDQINNYGQAAAIGRNAVGTLNHQHQWSATIEEGSPQELVKQLERLRQELNSRASTREDSKQVGVIADADAEDEAEAEKEDAGAVLKTFEKTAKWTLGVAKEIGTDLAAKLIAKVLGVDT